MAALVWPTCLSDQAFFLSVSQEAEIGEATIRRPRRVVQRTGAGVVGVLMIPMYAQEWHRVLLSFSPQVRAVVRHLVGEHGPMLANHFYEAMLEDAEAAAFLSHGQVQSRLKPTLQMWLQEVYALDPEADLAAIAQRQIKVGEVHARIDLPVYLVLRGAARIKEGVHQLLLSEPLEAAQRLSASQLVARIMDLAMEIMAQAYATSRERNSRSKEAYRLFALTQNVSTVRERRRAELLDWQNQCLFNHAMGAAGAAMPSLLASDFGLWFRHKGAHLFQGVPDTDAILRTMQEVDAVLLPAFRDVSPTDVMPLLNALREHTRSISLHLETLFEHNTQMDAGRDALTHLLNRKFLPVVLSKEVAYARETGTQFSVLTLDIDHFKRINDVYGHEAGDMVLQQLAAMLSNNVRGGDYLFRLGGEEFLLLLVDTTAISALRVAEKLRAQVEREVFTAPRNTHLAVSISIGVATYDGHPDYQRVLRQSDEALYAAKAQGRNCVISHEEVVA